jgi:sugar phosphate permease
LSFFPYANATVLWVAIFWGAVQTIPWVMDIIVVETLAQRWTEPEMRGRVFSLFQMQRSAGKLLAAGLFAPLVDLLGPVLLMNAAGVIYTIVALFALRGRAMMKQEPETEAPSELIPMPAE